MAPPGPGIAGELDTADHVAEPTAGVAPGIPAQPGEKDDAEREGGGPKDSKDTITREWHERKLRRESQRRQRIEAEARRLRDENKAYREKEAKMSSQELLKDLGLPPEQEAMVGVLGKVTERILGRVEDRLARHGEQLGELTTEFQSERRRSMLRGLDDDQQELVTAIQEETGLKNPNELLALAKARDPELFAGYEPDKGSFEASPARGAPASRRLNEPPTIDEQITALEAEMKDPKNRRRIHTELGPKLMGLRRLRAQGMR